MSREQGRHYSDRALAYRAGRPAYPAAVLDGIRAEAGLVPPATVANIGSGTGIFTAMLLRAGYRVYAVEPDDEMRALSDAALSESPRYQSIAGTGEDTGLPDRSVDAVTFAQSLHWLDPARARAETSRVIRPGGALLALWNELDLRASAFNHDLGHVLEQLPGYRAMRAWEPDPIVLAKQAFPQRARVWVTTHSHDHALSRTALIDRFASASYAPPPASAESAALANALGAVFEAHQERGQVSIRYRTIAVVGRMPFAMEAWRA